MRFLFLGDSYTCCEQESSHANRWPLQLAAKACGKNIDELKIVCKRLEDGEKGVQWISEFDLIDIENNELRADLKIIAKTGKRSDELYENILKGKSELSEYDAVFILIGVNDQFQRGENGIAEFETYLSKIITEAIDTVRHSAPITILAIPDWSATPMGSKSEVHSDRSNYFDLDISSKENTSREITLYNSAAKKTISQIKDKHLSPITFVENIERISREFGLLPGMTQEDGLHYCWKMTEKWNDVLFGKIPFLQKQVYQPDEMTENSFRLG
jgi:hypothetical protein